MPPTEIDSYRVAPGTTVLEAAETVLRACGGVYFTSNLQSDLVAVVGTGASQGTVREGVDILEGREIIYNPAVYQETTVVGQNIPNDQKWGPPATQMQGKASSTSPTGQGKQLIPLELPAFKNDMLVGRANMDRNFQNSDEVTVFVTVQGWHRPSGGLWQRSPATISVVSPMLILDGSELLQVKSVTFSQDNNSGTRTVLECTNTNAWAPVPQAPQ